VGGGGRGRGTREALKVLSAFNGDVCFDTRSRWFISAWAALQF